MLRLAKVSRAEARAVQSAPLGTVLASYSWAAFSTPSLDSWGSWAPWPRQAMGLQASWAQLVVDVHRVHLVHHEGCVGSWEYVALTSVSEFAHVLHVDPIALAIVDCPAKMSKHSGLADSS